MNESSEMPARRQSKRPHERVECPWCHRSVAARIPAGGDGSGVRLSRHAEQFSNAICVGSGEVV